MSKAKRQTREEPAQATSPAQDPAGFDVEEGQGNAFMAEQLGIQGPNGRQTDQGWNDPE